MLAVTEEDGDFLSLLENKKITMEEWWNGGSCDWLLPLFVEAIVAAPVLLTLWILTSS